MAAKLIRKVFSGPALVVLVLALLLLSLRLISSASLDAVFFDKLYYVLLALNLVILLLLLFLISRQGLRLYRHLKQGIAGARLTLRMVIIFVGLAILPATIVYSFSIQFIHRSIDSWFDETVEQALEDALNLSRSSVDERKKALLRQFRQLSDDKIDQLDNLSVLSLAEIREKGSVESVTLLTSKGRVLGSSSVEEGDIVPDLPNPELLLPLQQGRDHAVLDLSDDSRRFIRVLIRLTFPGEDGFLILQAISPLSERQYKMAASVQQAYSEYKSLVYLRKPLKASFTLTLSLVLFLGILSAVWAAFFSARRLASPIRDLAEGTRAVAEGDYHKPIPLLDNDDLGQLVQSFNKMVRQLSRTHDQLEESHQQAKQQRDYLEVILSNLSSGIMSLDERERLRTCNPEACLILDVDLNKFIGQPLEKLLGANSELEPLIRLINSSIGQRIKNWNEQMTLSEREAQKILLCRGNALNDGGYVIVIENMTYLVKAQRDAAWGEVARRLAHEIKNPLTPIQLSAERLRHKYLKTMPAKDAETMDRLTATIINQVASMKEMVKAFSEYARMPELNVRKLDIQKLLTEVIDLYHSNKRLNINQKLSISGVMVEADQGRLRQVFHNLIKNALEACVDQELIILTISGKLTEIDNKQWIIIKISDNGPGFPLELLTNIFDPYVTNKAKGTGLGLAIVKKIIEEHGGIILAENLLAGGASVSIRLPVIEINQIINIK